MRTFVPRAAGDGPSADWGIRRAVRLAFPGPAALAADPVHTERLRTYLTDLLRPYRLGLEPGALERGGGQSYGEMAEALIRLAVPAGESVDLLVLAYAVPDITPGRATTTYLSHVCPGAPMAFAVSDQGSAAAFTACRLIHGYAETGGLRRALLLVVEQDTLPYDPGLPVTVPSASRGVALLFGEPEPGERVARLGRVTTHVLPEDPRDAPDLLGALDGGPVPATEPLGAFDTARAPVTALLGGALAARLTVPVRADLVRTADAGQPGTGVWWELADLLTDQGQGQDQEPTPAARSLLLADYDPVPRHLSTAAIDVRAAVTAPR
ncbi:hypothetical protein [Streptacidiphilus cavernicola]|uniref:2-hydroxy-acid oxidase n=1 Tax=Streptacidiphilus cavernicola TaxID=3342716 RepID=A0ABV6VPN7_9ACTN